MTWVAVISARTDSSRLPGKALLPLAGVPVIVYLIRRLKSSAKVREFILATTDRAVDNDLADVVLREGIPVFRGAMDDVLGRCVLACDGSKADHFVRITGDCPFVSGETLDEVLGQCEKIPGGFDLATTKPAYPHGIDYEVAPLDLMRKINRMELIPEEREHLMNYIYRREQEFRVARLDPPPALAGCRDEFLLDTPADYEKIRGWAEGSGPRPLVLG